MRAVVVDASFILAVCDRENPMHGRARQTLHDCAVDGHQFVVPASVLVDVWSAALQASPQAVRTVESMIDELTIVHVIDQPTARAAARWRARAPGISLQHSLVLGAANTARAVRIATTDPNLMKLNHSRIPSHVFNEGNDRR